ncbi:Trp family transcriptional regulator [Neptunomonas concharum]|uniref:Transcriptional regulator n=1 Tax=Neptunomonas concharum TaxID=1031538 RepID=A0A5P1R8P9_9GAMM|nr:Trp family transcriptional regulator [Neptunomonas concharum]QEQ95681.1 transcriptional regulator [Neptunomonas concharum]
MNTGKQHITELVDYLLAVKQPDEMEKVLRSLLTPTEFTEVTKRLQIFKMLEQGVPQRQIADTLGVGIATVTRGSRALKGE